MMPSKSALVVIAVVMAACARPAAEPPATGPEAPAAASGAPAAPVAPAPAAARPRVVVGTLRQCTPLQPICFDEEMADVAAAITERLGEHGYEVVPDAELRQLYRDVRAGQLPGLAQACPNPPPGHRVVDLLYAGARDGRAYFDCDEAGCELEVTVDVEPDRQRYVIALPATETAAQWAARIRQQGFTRASEEEEEGAMGGLGLMGDGKKPRRPPGVYASIWAVEQSGPWSYELDDARFQRLAAAFDACEREHEAPRMAWGRFPFTLAIDAQGHVSRCESSDLDLMPFSDAACKCAVLARIDFGKGSAERRARFHVRIEHEPRRPMYGQAHQSEEGQSDDPYVLLGLGGVSDKTLSACLAPLTQPMKHTAAVRFQVRADGSTEQASASWPAELPSSVRACLDAALLKAQFTCPRAGRAEVASTISLSIQPPRR
jgi:hypothetical protein